MKTYKNNTCIIYITLLLILILTGCAASTSRSDATSTASSIRVYTTETCEITDIDYHHWYASGHHYTCSVTVYCEAYDISRTFSTSANDAKQLEHYKTGDSIEATIYYEQMRDSGEAFHHTIHSLNP